MRLMWEAHKADTIIQRITRMEQMLEELSKVISDLHASAHEQHKVTLSALGGDKADVVELRRRGY